MDAPRPVGIVVVSGALSAIPTIGGPLQTAFDALVERRRYRVETTAREIVDTVGEERTVSRLLDDPQLEALLAEALEVAARTGFPPSACASLPPRLSRVHPRCSVTPARCSPTRAACRRRLISPGTPCITLRPSTEWTETVEEGWNVLVDLDRDAMLEALDGGRRRAPAAVRGRPRRRARRRGSYTAPRMTGRDLESLQHRRRRARLLGPEPGAQLRRAARLRAGLVLRRLRGGAGARWPPSSPAPASPPSSRSCSPIRRSMRSPWRRRCRPTPSSPSACSRPASTASSRSRSRSRSPTPSAVVGGRAGERARC